MGEVGRDIIKNQAVCRACGTFLESKHRHDFVMCACGKSYLDGGTDYIKCSFTTMPDGEPSIETMPVYRFWDDSEFERYKNNRLKDGIFSIIELERLIEREKAFNQKLIDGAEKEY